MKQVRVASAKDSDQISNLRLTEYQSSKDFILVNSIFLEWGGNDKNCPVISVWNEEDEVIATILLTPVKNTQSAIEIIEYNLPTEISFPALVFSKAATKKSYRKKGLNQLLRYYCIKAALDYNINSLLSPVFKQAPRIAFMKEMGYQFYTPLETSQTKLIPVSIRKLAVLERSKMEYAIKIIEKKIPNLIKEYPWQGESIIL